MSTITCPSCSQANPDTNLFCSHCGEMLDRFQKTPKIDVGNLRVNYPQWGNARISSRHRLVLRLVNSLKQIRIDLVENQPVTLGRADPLADIMPDFDLSRYNGLAMGVSRRHASLVMQDNTLQITDLDSTNGTYLNGKRLIPYRPNILRDGDEIRLGDLRMLAMFVEVTDPFDRAQEARR